MTRFTKTRAGGAQTAAMRRWVSLLQVPSDGRVTLGVTSAQARLFGREVGLAGAPRMGLPAYFRASLLVSAATTVCGT